MKEVNLMSSYICEKCGCIENTALGGYWSNLAKKEPIKCSECNTGKWHDMFEKKHWSEYGTQKLLELESKNDGSMINATSYLKSINVIK